MPPTMLRTTFSPSVVTHVSVSWGEPSGIRVATKHGLGLRRRSTRPSGSGVGIVRSYPLSVRVSTIEHMFDVLDFDPASVDEAGLIEHIEALEKFKCTAAAAQARATAALDGIRRAAEAERGVPASKR